jgi:crotonobetainyl-CoA:carnitine CoA-transferase CaiB-like acyl-CoA transferase
MFEVAVAAMTVYHDLQGQFFPGPLAQSIETPSIEPAADGWIGFCTYTGQQWKDFCLMIGRPELAEDERFYDAKARMDHLPFIREAIHAWTRERTVAEILETASLLRLPVAPIGNGRNALDFDHFAERGVFVESPHGFRHPRVPYRLGSGRTRPFAAAPRPGEHGDSLRREARRTRPPPRSEGGGALPLEGVRVVDLSAFWAGPVLCATLAALGADVVKVESIQRPDGMRFAGAVRNEIMWEHSPVFHGANTGKRAVTLNLDDTEGRALLRRLVEGADALVENFSPRVMDHFGLGYEVLSRWNPRLVMLRMPAWGLEGPWRERTGFAASVEQASGLAWITGYRDMPLIVRGACDPVGGMHALLSLLAALEVRRRTGRGQLVECALAEPALNLAAEQVIEWSAYGRLLERDGNRGPAAAPQGVYRCRGEDAWVAVSVASDAQWAGLSRALGDPPFSRDAALANAAGRRAAHDAIDAALLAWCAERTPEEAAESLRAEGVAAEWLANAHFLLPNPQLEARGFFHELEHPFAGRLRYPGLPMRFSAIDPRKLMTPPPTLGQHNDEVLGGELGLARDELSRLRAAKVIGSRPAWVTDDA